MSLFGSLPFLAAILNTQGTEVVLYFFAMTSVAVENVKRELEEVDREEHFSNRKRNKSEPLNPLWKFW